MRALLVFAVLVSGCARPAADAAAIQLADAAPAGWNADDSVVISAQRWAWEVQWPEQSDSELVLPTDRPIKLELHARDVAHRLQFPELGLDLTASPQQPAVAWVTLTRGGEWQSRCVQECPEHAGAFTLSLRAVSPAEHTTYRQPGASPAGLSPAVWGASLYRQHACASCHHLDDTLAGPPLRRFWGSEATAIGGRKVLVEGDAGLALIRESMLEPTAFQLDGYGLTMPSYRGLLSDAQLDAIAALLRCLARPDEPDCKQAVAALEAP